jgi:hypothetical protein
MQTMAAAAWTGRNVTLPDAIWVVMLFFLSFFCISNVMLTQSVYSREGSLWLRSQPFLNNQMFWSRKILVRHISCCGTLKYSHKRMAKKKARMVSCKNCTLQLRQSLLGNFENDTGGNGFLLFFFWVGILVGSELAL